MSAIGPFSSPKSSVEPAPFSRSVVWCVDIKCVGGSGLGRTRRMFVVCAVLCTVYCDVWFGVYEELEAAPTFS